MTTTFLTSLTTSTQTLANTDDLYVASGAFLQVIGASAVSSTAGAVTVQNYGSIFSNAETLSLGTPASGSVSMVFNGLGGTITAGGFGNTAAVSIQGFHVVENHGQIVGNMYIGSGIKTNDDGEIVNYGTISARSGILNYGDSSAQNTIVNHGTIAGSNRSIWVQNDATVTIINTGLLDGDVALGNGVGFFSDGSSLDSSLGTVRGSIYGGLGRNVIASGRNGNQVFGGDENDALSGNGGNDTLQGDAGNDVVSGDEGNDKISIFDTDGIDTVDGGSGVDFLNLHRESLTVGLAVSIALPGDEQTLADGTSYVNFEQLEFYGGSGRDNVIGGARADYLVGNSGNDTLDGRGGNDTAFGGAGADSYVVDRLGDFIQETVVSTAAAERDTVTFTGTSGTYVLGVNLETLVLGGTAAINGTGNAGVNAITGNAAANVLNGMAGADLMMGMGGSDSYFADVVGDQALETLVGTAGGTDTVTFTGASGTFTLGANVERLTLGGAAAINGAGNELANIITGNAGSNVIAGGLGNDTLTGGLGADFFVFNTLANTSTNKDTITDFNAPADTIRLENAIFTALGAATGVLNASLFKNLSLAAIDADDRILYNDGTGAISYDIDGSGAAVAVVLAVITGAPTLTNADFMVI